MLPIIFRGHEEPGFFAHAVGMRPGPSPLVVLPGNQRTEGSRYACLIVVKDYVTLAPRSGTVGAWHYTSLEPEILADVRDGRAVLVFDLSNEGPAYDRSLFHPLYSWIESQHLPPGRCIWLAQNRLMGNAAKDHLGTRAAMIQFHHYDYFVKLIAWRFSQAGVTDIMGPNPWDYLERLFDSERKDRLLLCLNATPRLVRTLTVAALHHHLLLHRSLVSFPGLDYIKTGARLSEVLAFIEDNPSLEYLRPWIHAIGRMSALRVDDFHEQGNQLVEKIDPRVYERTFFSLVTESDFAERGIARVTEKSIKAFCMGHPTLIIGNADAVGIVRSFGFEDWTGVLDRTAETTSDAAARFESVLAEVNRQVLHIQAGPQAWVATIREISEYNHQYAVSGRFLTHYVDAFDRPLVTLMSTLIAG